MGSLKLQCGENSIKYLGDSSRVRVEQSGPSVEVPSEVNLSVELSRVLKLALADHEKRIRSMLNKFTVRVDENVGIRLVSLKRELLGEPNTPVRKRTKVSSKKQAGTGASSKNGLKRAVPTQVSEAPKAKKMKTVSKTQTSGKRTSARLTGLQTISEHDDADKIISNVCSSIHASEKEEESGELYDDTADDHGVKSVIPSPPGKVYDPINPENRGIALD